MPRVICRLLVLRTWRRALAQERSQTAVDVVAQCAAGAACSAVGMAEVVTVRAGFPACLRFSQSAP